jgi:hypothetical protein
MPKFDNAEFTGVLLIPCEKNSTKIKMSFHAKDTFLLWSRMDSTEFWRIAWKTML